MKKRAALMISIVFWTISLGGCMGWDEQLSNQMILEQQISDQMMEKILVTLDTKDEKGLKDLFSKSALLNSEEIEHQISNLMDFYKGKMKSFEGDASSDTRTNYGKDEEKKLVGQYFVITDKKSYRVMYEYSVIDKKNDNIGLSQLEFVTDELYQTDDFDWLCGKNGPGIYIQK